MSSPLSDSRRIYLRQYRKAWRRRNPEHLAYRHAKERCERRNDPKWDDYGGRGIKMVYASFAEFIADVGKRPGAGFSLDRINNDGHYAPGNCRWATASQQNNNRRNSNGQDNSR